jgi:CubicO group peptidase (beta-lactamase class C family)
MMPKFNRCFFSIFMGLFVAAQVVSQNTRSASSEYWPTQAWRSSAPEQQGMDSDKLADALGLIRQHGVDIHSLLIIRNGYVILDANFYPFQEGQLHDLASVTKSVTSTLIGIAIGQHRIAGVNQPLLSLFSQREIANRDERKARVTIQNLLTMTSGLDCRFRPNEITLSEMTHSKDWVQFMLNLPMAAEPGSKYEYCSGGMHLLSGIISQTTGVNSFEFAKRELFQPLGIHDVVWPSDPNGVTYGWGDLHLRPRDAAKIGYLWLNHGRWGERQIVPAEYLQEATNKAGAVDPVKIAFALEGLKHKDFLGYDTVMRKDDHQLISEYFVGTFKKGVKYDAEGTGLGWAISATILAKDIDQPNTCKMKRPGA